MPQQRLAWLLCALLFAWSGGGTAGSSSVDHSDLSVYVFSSLQTSSGGDSLPPYPEGIELELACQAAARTTYWYERRPPKVYPDASEDKLPSRSANPVPGVSQRVFTIPHLEGKDDGRELWCTMDGSSIKKVVKLTVVGPPSPPVINYIASGDGLDLECSSQEMSDHLELCWYQDDERLQCKFLAVHEGPPTTVKTHIAGDAMVGKVALVCKARLKEDSVVETLNKKTQEHFTAMFKKASVEVEIEGQELAPCHDDKLQSKSSDGRTFNLRNPDNNLCRKVDINELKIPTAAPSTTPMATTTTPASHEERKSPAIENGGSAIAVVTLPLLLTLALVLAQ